MLLQEKLLPLLISFLLGFLLNSVLYMMPDIVTMKKMMMTPTLQNYQFFQLPGEQREVEAPSPSSMKEEEIRSSSRNISEVRILCWVMTGPQNHYTKAIHVKNTWGSHCDKLLFMSSQADPDLGAVALDIKEGRQQLWGKTKQAFKYVFENHWDEADWFMKADDDTFVVVENLKNLLKDFNTNDPIGFGHNFKYLGGYFSGGAGYVLSREALRRFTQVGLNNSTLCKEDDGGDEDVNMGSCMKNLNITRGDSRDSLERKRFFPFHPADHLIPSMQAR